MNIHELNEMITLLENEQRPENDELIKFYKKKKKELIVKIGSEVERILYS